MNELKETEAKKERQELENYNILVDCNYAGVEGELAGRVKCYKTIKHALDSVSVVGTQVCTIFIKEGRYYEKITIDKPSVTLVGEKLETTILTYDAAADTKKSDGTTYGTSGSATLTIAASNFTAKNLTVENGFDYHKNLNKEDTDPTKFANPQAVAVKTDLGSDQTLFSNCKLLGYQDTLFANCGRHYYKNCSIWGNIDFIFGAGQAVFEECDIIARKGPSNINNGYITAPSTQLQNPYGFLFLCCNLKRESTEIADGTVALGRPWHPTSDLQDGTRAADPSAVGAVVFKNCYMDSHIALQGWAPMHGRDKDGNTIYFYPEDSRFYEYGSKGPGAFKSKYRTVLSEEQSKEYTAEVVLNGWDVKKFNVF